MPLSFKFCVTISTYCICLYNSFEDPKLKIMFGFYIYILILGFNRKSLNRKSKILLLGLKNLLYWSIMTIAPVKIYMFLQAVIFKIWFLSLVSYCKQKGISSSYTLLGGRRGEGGQVDIFTLPHMKRHYYISSEDF